MKKSFQNNMTEFQSILADRGEFQANDNSAFLHEFTKDDIEIALENMEPGDVEILPDFIKARFDKNIFLTKMKTEKEFLLKFQDVICELENYSLSRKLLKSELLPIVKKSIELVENFFPETTDDRSGESHEYFAQKVISTLHFKSYYN